MQLRTASTFLATLGLLVSTSGCKDFYDVNVDPIRPTTAQIQQLLPGTQVAMSTYLGFNIQGLGQYTSSLMRQLQNDRALGTYLFTNDAFNGQWNGLYTDMLANNEQIIRQGTAEERWDYVGVAKIQKAFVFSQLVDMFGDVPYSQALQGIDQRFPRFDKDVDIYMGNQAAGIQGLFSLIDEGIADIDRPGVKTIILPSGNDIIYRGNLDNWKAMARTLKLKLYNQIRKANVMDVSGPVRALLAQQATQPLIASNATDFELAYGSSQEPANRHIGYLGDYANTTPENRIGRFFYLFMKYGDGFNFGPNRPPQVASADPRIPYYFYNQTGATTENPAFDYQDPGDRRFITVRFAANSNTANAGDAGDRTLPGLYPYGGRFDDGKNARVTEASGSGTVPQRMLTYFNRKFTEAELQLMVLNDPAAAQTAYIEAVRAAYEKVNSIAVRQNASGGQEVRPLFASDSVMAKLVGGTYTQTIAPVPTNPLTPRTRSVTTRGSYGDDFAKAATTERKLELIMQQKYVASFGMGNDIYTDFRRTHYPKLPVPNQDQAQPDLGLIFSFDQKAQATGGNFPRRLFYPIAELQTNTSSPGQQVSPSSANYRIFWDR